MAKGGGHNKGQTMPYSSVRAFGEKKPMRQGHWSLGAARYSLNESLVTANARSLEIEASIIDRETGDIVWQPSKCGVCRTAWATEARGDEEWSLCRECFAFVDEHTDPPSSAKEVVSEQQGPSVEASPPMIIGESRSGKTSLAAVMELAHKLHDDAQLVVMELAAGEIEALDPLYGDCLTRSPGADPSGLITALDRLNVPRAVWSDGTVVARANGMLWRMRAEPHAVTGEPCGVWSVWGPIGCRGHFMPEKAARFIANRPTP